MNNTVYEKAVNAINTTGEFQTITKGKSMYPMLRDGKDIVIIKKAVFPLKAGEVALYRKSGAKELVLHRVLKHADGGYIIRGDNTYHREFVPQEDIVGVLDGFFRKGKYRNCKTDRAYRLYVLFARFCFPVRYAFAVFRAVLRKLKIKKD